MKVLIATDGSKSASAAMAAASRILRTGNRGIDLMCVIPGDGRKEAFRRRAMWILGRAKGALAAETAGDMHTLIGTGSPARALVSCSRAYDVIVVGARSHKDGSTAGLGPVASRVLEHAGASVLLGRQPRSEGGLRILVPVDGSEGSLRTLDKLPSLVDLSFADVTLVHVVETPWLHADLEQEWSEFEGEDEAEAEIDPQAQLEHEFEVEGEKILEDARGRLPARTAATTLLYRGLPAGEILSEVESGEYDLVAMTASHAADLKHRMLGSVSVKVAWNAPCSVLMVHPE